MLRLPVQDIKNENVEGIHPFDGDESPPFKTFIDMVR
jgi:hypothetical protein